MDRVTAFMQTQAAADAMEHDGVVPESGCFSSNCKKQSFWKRVYARRLCRA